MRYEIDRHIQPTIHYAPETCAYCSGYGSGRCRDGKIYDTCPVCHGPGSVLVAQVAKKCAFCSGEGGGGCRDGFHYDICPICKGTGWSYVYMPEEEPENDQKKD
ncbi:MAG: hypothetical protein GYA34_02405 [Chloroflexi bacterium]|nr:hypothetical protein [Chloroflexota bacterium]